jgi:hypothetical protein
MLAGTHMLAFMIAHDQPGVGGIPEKIRNSGSLRSVIYTIPQWKHKYIFAGIILMPDQDNA